MRQYAHFFDLPSDKTPVSGAIASTLETHVQADGDGVGQKSQFSFQPTMVFHVSNNQDAQTEAQTDPRTNPGADPRTKRIVDRAVAAGETVPSDQLSQVDWLNEVTVDDPAGRYLTEIWRERTDLWETFPGMFLDPDAALRFRLWAHHFAASECDAPAELIPEAPVGINDLIAPPATGPASPLTPGVQLYGYLRATLGLGEAARRLVTLLALAQEPTLARPYDHIGSPLAYPWPDPVSIVPSEAAGSVHDSPNAEPHTADPAATLGLPTSQTTLNETTKSSSALTTGQTISNDAVKSAAQSGHRSYDIAILCVNGAETARLTRAIGPTALHGRYRIGLWFWELEQLTPEMAAGLDHLDEVWVTSEFVAAAVRNAAAPNFPVHILPLGMDLDLSPQAVDSSGSDANQQQIDTAQAPGDHHPVGHTTHQTPLPTGDERAAIRTRLGLPKALAHGLVIGCSFDYASRIARKNPLGLIEAFIKAFPKPFSPGNDLGPWLVVKAFNPGATPPDAAAVRDAVAGRPDIVLFEEHLSPEDQRAYLSSLDVVASLHRSEGYGLIMLEAMAQGIPTMATEYSGNLAFMSHRNSWLIPAQRITIDESASPYPAGYTWAEPDIGSAASTLRWIVSGLTTSSSRALADVTNRTKQALLDTRPLINGTAGAAFVRKRLTEIRTARKP
jgi:glycosyltransferase involved in cell wall biosynthesis